MPCKEEFRAKKFGFSNDNVTVFYESQVLFFIISAVLSSKNLNDKDIIECEFI